MEVTDQDMIGMLTRRGAPAIEHNNDIKFPFELAMDNSRKAYIFPSSGQPAPTDINAITTLSGKRVNTIPPSR